MESTVVETGTLKVPGAGAWQSGEDATCDGHSPCQSAQAQAWPPCPVLPSCYGVPWKVTGDSSSKGDLAEVPAVVGI